MTKHHLKNEPKKIIFEFTFNDPISQPLRDYLKESSPISGRSLRKYFFKGLIRLNQKKAHSQAIIKRGDHIQILEMGPEHQALPPETTPIEVVFENPDILVVNKPPLLATHPSGNITANTLANRVAGYLNKTGHPVKVRPVNRLDYGTSGLVIFAKNALTQDHLSRAIQDHQIARIYYAVVQGIPENEAGSINLPIGIVKGIRKVTENGQPAETHYRNIEKLSAASLLELTLKTGRTHQIRIHLGHTGYPIIGDKQYGVKSPLIGRPALHAGKLVFKTPEFDLPEITVPLPRDMVELISTLKKPLPQA